MELEQFIEKVVGALKEFYGEEARIRCHEIYKNNGVKMKGLSILMGGQSAAPTVYLNQFYDQYRKGKEFSEIFSRIIDEYEENQLSTKFDIDFLMDYHKVKGRLVLRLIHKERNQELLENIPYRCFQDLAVVCHCLVVNEVIGTGSILIHRDNLDLWGIDEDELFRSAQENSPRLQPANIQKMEEILREIWGSPVRDRVEEICQEYPQNKERMIERTLENMEEEIEGRGLSMLILTNQGRYYGAACILYRGMLEEIAERMRGDFYILPSSVHELILLKKKEGDEEGEFNRMVQEVNAGYVDPQEWLSNHVYLYKKEEKRVISL